MFVGGGHNLGDGHSAVGNTDELLLTVTPIGHLGCLGSIHQSTVLLDAQVIARRRHWPNGTVELERVELELIL